ncbi:uncharacterized protein LOC141853820 [Brevipalpus obovatus]|uniref:uncharacterized protein LOC141853820 n=1 Tax=Brevipalpus obovatus TaxID=246614 RepID=UPI003D9DD4C4
MSSNGANEIQRKKMTTWMTGKFLYECQVHIEKMILKDCKEMYEKTVDKVFDRYNNSGNPNVKDRYDEIKGKLIEQLEQNWRRKLYQRCLRESVLLDAEKLSKKMVHYENGLNVTAVVAEERLPIMEAKIVDIDSQLERIKRLEDEEKLLHSSLMGELQSNDKEYDKVQSELKNLLKIFTSN